MPTTLPAAAAADVPAPHDTPLVGIIMGSQSDLKIMSVAAELLQQFGITYEITLVSAHRTPHRLVEYAETARKRGLRVIIAGGGGAAHLPGMVASFTTLPVIGVPINSTTSFHGLDSILSMLQMPAGVPVATVALDGASNAAVLATQILALGNARLADVLEKYRTSLKDKVMRTIEELRKGGFNDD
ncbi:5-(carboxyamino)imidazole ribonucleotide mutase [Hymenobacter sp. 5516J-16]|uniref:N5-carboxyaminoimidazole ribonucleotide mutase n=2 Tax=Hymenobacter TaxID=89966 RepID=A0ABY4JC19_9BACT|nr:MULTISPECIES: 5-(carboxyamino)imidazole ribonucleotide mutase [Hymenobacter]UOQ76343.1 5-(carboxyamino)imidazole ribonucleotide mutase [Hymenobacter sp. 5516J-16]UPL50011.1 5-(carboxyamino)imidazole ribonucleotide mutase [Hymenobacter sublimis]GGG36417.1 5-(carboxyamino)imidazole ribonucleotide mutase [Hymenobacter glacieicola]